MESYKLALKLFVKGTPDLAGHELVPIFHSWIQQKRLTDHLTIDVADYAHVPNGPGTLLITLEANIATDRENGELGLLYIRKLPIANAETFSARLRAVALSLFKAAEWIEEEPKLGKKINFRTDELLFRVYDRLLAPNMSETFESVKANLEAFVTELYGSGPLSMTFIPGTESLFEVRIKTPGSKSVADLCSRLELDPVGV